ncbi:MAG TPA: triose-phosphate isomerase [Thermoanaerobaculia bacterium]|nr:triose-phosphate isomerase [Thermoanaerobaculia bacterium]
MSRRPIAAGNWKMHLTSAAARALARGLRQGLPPDGPEVVVFPSFPLLPAVADELAGSPVGWGGQDLSRELWGARTGEVSPLQLTDAGCRWVLVGHSERRHGHGEDDALVAGKLAAALGAGLAPILCLGETRQERRAGRTWEVLGGQLDAAVEAAAGQQLTVAYEPVWAIGTGDTATPEQAQEAHAFLRRRLEERAGRAAAAASRILYGGSVKPDNAAELFARQDLDGFLVGGASLDAVSFLAIIAACGGRAAESGGSP